MAMGQQTGTANHSDADTQCVQKDGDTTKEPDVNSKFTAEGGVSIFDYLEAGKESGFDEGVGSIGVGKKPFNVR